MGTADFDLTGQLVWPGAMLLNDYLSKNAEILRGCSVIELGSGVGKWISPCFFLCTFGSCWSFFVNKTLAWKGSSRVKAHKKYSRLSAIGIKCFNNTSHTKYQENNP